MSLWKSFYAVYLSVIHQSIGLRILKKCQLVNIEAYFCQKNGKVDPEFVVLELLRNNPTKKVNAINCIV